MTATPPVVAMPAMGGAEGRHGRGGLFRVIVALIAAGIVVCATEVLLPQLLRPKHGVAMASSRGLRHLMQGAPPPRSPLEPHAATLPPPPAAPPAALHSKAASLLQDDIIAPFARTVSSSEPEKPYYQQVYLFCLCAAVLPVLRYCTCPDPRLR